MRIVRILKEGVEWAEGGNPTQAAAAGFSPISVIFGMAWPMLTLGFSPQM